MSPDIPGLSVTPHLSRQRTVNPHEPRLDQIDLRILALLAENARLSSRALARDLEMSVGAISERISKLEQKGIITGYHTAIDPAKVGFGMFAIIGLQTDQGPVLDRELETLLNIPEVLAVHTVAGRWDLVLEVRVRDTGHLRRIVLERIWKVPGFRHSETMISLESRASRKAWHPARSTSDGRDGTAHH